MGTKSLIFLWLVVSALVGYICIYSKADEIYSQIQAKLSAQKPKSVEKVVQTPASQSQAQEVQKETKPESEIVSVKKEQIVVPNLKDPSFAYVSGEKEKIACFLSKKDENSSAIKRLDEICGSDCLKDIKYFDDIKKIDFMYDIVNVVKFAKEKKINNFALYIDKDELKIEGSYEDTSIKDKLQNILVPFMNRGYNITDNTKVIEQALKEKVEVESTAKMKKDNTTSATVATKEVAKPKQVEIKPKVENKPISKSQAKPKRSKVVKKALNSKKDVVVRDVFDETGVGESIDEPEITTSTKSKTSYIVVEDEFKELGTVEPSESAEVIEEKIEQAPPTPVQPISENVQNVEQDIESILVSYPIRFKLKSSELTQESKKTLNEVVDKILSLDLDSITIEVAGYTDATGDATYNKVLSQSRADSVKEYLIKSGIRRDKVHSKGYGETKFIGDPNDKINRRVEIHLREVK